MSLATCIGREQNVFNETFGHAHRVLFQSPILLYSDPPAAGTGRGALSPCCAEPQLPARRGLQSAPGASVRRGQDRGSQRHRAAGAVGSGHQSGHPAHPGRHGGGALQRTLVDNNLRCDANILVETASVRDPHHFAVLLGFGATAIYPYLAYETLAKQVEEGVLKMSLRQAMLNYRNGINKGLYKVMSKMGISTVAATAAPSRSRPRVCPAPWWSALLPRRIEPHPGPTLPTSSRIR